LWRRSTGSANAGTQDTGHNVVGRGIEIVEPGNVPQLVRHAASPKITMTVSLRQ
jgi:hypothetical protein